MDNTKEKEKAGSSFLNENNYIELRRIVKELSDRHSEVANPDRERLDSATRVETLTVKIDKGDKEMDMIMIKPNDLPDKDLPAYIFVHGGGVVLDA